MNTSGANKRKKRKTRKYLDELWKKSRLPNHSLVSDSVRNSKKGNTGKSNNCITMNRLTLKAKLNVCPKAIRSDIITRPNRAEIQQFNSTVQQKNIDDNIKCSSSDGNSSLDKKSSKFATDYDDLNETNMANCNEINKITTLKQTIGHLTHRADSYILFSPLDSTREVISIGNSSMPNSTQMAHGYKFYKEFMNEISTYLKQNSPDFHKEYVVKETKTCLQSLCLEHCRRECNGNIFRSKPCDSEHANYTLVCRKTIVQNPVDYIRQAQLGSSLECRANYDTGSSAISSTIGSASPAQPSVHASFNSLGSSNPHSPGLAGGSRSLPESFITPSRHSSPAASRSSSSPGYEGTAICDTPDYIYYPHKLTQ